MANVIQVYEIVNSIAEQALGLTNLAATDVSFVSVGKEVLSSDENKDVWYKVLVDRIGATIVSMRKLDDTENNVRREPLDWGIAVQKLTVNLQKAKENTSWKGQSDTHSDPFEKTQFTVNQKIFSKMSVWDVDGTIPDVQLRTAFESPQKMAIFINALMMSMDNTLVYQVQQMDRLCRASFIARKFAQGKTRAINLLAEYNTQSGETLTATQAISSIEFLRYAAMRISLICGYLKDMSVLFSDGTLERHTPTDLQCLDVNAEFSKRMAYYLQSDTYHKDLVSMPRFREVNTWQAVSEQYTFADTSRINITYTDNDGANVTFNRGGIIAVLYDWEALGTTINTRRTRSIYNPKDEYTNYFNKVEIGYFNDVSENGVVFYIEDTTPAMTVLEDLSSYSDTNNHKK